MEAKEEIVNQEKSGPDPEPLERGPVDGSKEEEVDGDGDGGQPGHERDSPDLGVSGLGDAQPQGQRGEEPDRDCYGVADPAVGGGPVEGDCG